MAELAKEASRKRSRYCAKGPAGSGILRDINRSWVRKCWARSLFERNDRRETQSGNRIFPHGALSTSNGKIIWRPSPGSENERGSGDRRIGVDMNHFPTAGIWQVWRECCPPIIRSAGKRKPERSAGQSIFEAALWKQLGLRLGERTDSYLSAAIFIGWCRTKPRRRAISQFCHSALIAAHHILRDGGRYHDPARTSSSNIIRPAIERPCVNQLKKWAGRWTCERPLEPSLRD